VSSSEARAPETLSRIGPNAITRVAEALEAIQGPTETVFAQAGLTHFLTELPEEMVDERDVTALQRALRAELDRDTARAVGWDAGLRTGDYLLAHRIPKPAQRILKLLPSRPASQMLLKAVAKHAWTFSGSGHFSYQVGRPVQVWIADCPLCRGARAEVPVCDFYRGAFERLFTTLVNPRTQVRETQCQALGAEACLFEMRW
jgi:divinyl protochlorophyllide a 8-vinyl-reductase